MQFLIKFDFFPETKQLTVGKIFNLYTINVALSDALLKGSSYSLLFFFDFFLQTVQYERNSPIYISVHQEFRYFSMKFHKRHCHFEAWTERSSYVAWNYLINSTCINNHENEVLW